MAAGTLIGIVIWLPVFLFGLSVSIGIFMWSMLRGVNGSFFVKRALILIVGFVFDGMTAGVVPIRTLTLIITIWLNNHFEKEKLDRMIAKLEKIEKEMRLLRKYGYEV